MANVLVVDDEPMIVQLVTMALKQNGYTVLIASGGVEALMVYSSYHSQIDLVLTDVVMPGMNGVELAERIRAQDPTVNILLMSGSVPEDIKVPPDLQLLAKPFVPTQLLKIVEQTLEAAPYRDLY
jgi:two-component system, cell cycle sensor histidine kinase and response regulator CckA